MFKSKKILAVILAAVMVFSLNITAFAAAPVTDLTDPEHEFTGNGSALDVETDLYKVTLPTNAAFNFVIDPLGLSALVAGQDKTAEELADFDGKIYFANTPAIFNESSMPIAVKASFALSDATDVVATQALLDAAATTDAPKLLFTVSPSAQALKAKTAAPFTGGLTMALDATAKSPIFLLENAEYKYHKEANGDITYVQTPDSVFGTQFQFAGACNGNGDYSEYFPTPAVAEATAVYTYPKVGADVAAFIAAATEAFKIGNTTFTGGDNVAVTDEATAKGNIISVLDAAYSDFTWSWSTDGADLIATADAAGAIAVGNAPGAYDKSTFTAATAANGAPVETVKGVTAAAEVPATKSINLNVTFTLAEATAEQINSDPDTERVAGAYGLLVTTGVTWDAPDEGFTAATATSKVNQAVEVEFLYNGSTVKSVKSGTSNFVLNGTTGNRYSVDEENDIIKFTCASAAERVIVVELSNGATYSITLTTTTV